VCVCGGGGGGVGGGGVRTLRGGQAKPSPSKKGSTSSLGPWKMILPALSICVRKQTILLIKHNASSQSRSATKGAS
jgi:hypothetical protein